MVKLKKGLSPMNVDLYSLLSLKIVKLFPKVASKDFKLYSSFRNTFSNAMGKEKQWGIYREIRTLTKMTAYKSSPSGKK